jgi:hypothetical protein
MYERLTDRARKVMHLSVKEADRFNHEYIGTEHILLGLVREGSGVAATVLKNLGVGLHGIRLKVQETVVSGPSMVTVGRLPQTPRAKKVIEYAIEEAHSLGHVCVGTEHILIGLLREDYGVAAQILMNLGLRLDQVRAETQCVLSQPHEWGRQQFTGMPPLQPIARRVETPIRQPDACPKCGNPEIIRVSWHRASISDQDMEDFKARKLLLGSISETDGPSWVCLRCSPRWSEVHDLAMQDWELQVAKETAIAAMKYDAAARHRDAQVDLRRQLRQLVHKLVKENWIDPNFDGPWKEQENRSWNNLN